MGSDAPLPDGTLMAFGAFTAAIVAAFTWYLIRSRRLAHLNPGRSSLAAVFVVLVAITGVMCFLLFNAFTYGEVRSRGQVYGLSTHPFTFWVFLAMYYGAAVLASVFGLVFAIRLIHPGRPPSGPALVKQEVEQLDMQSETSDAPEKPFTARWRLATIAYSAAAVIAALVYYRGDWGLQIPASMPIAVFAPIFVSLGFLAIYTGEVHIKGGPFYRSRNPILYWISVIAIFFFGLCLLLGGVIGLFQS